MIIAMTDLLLVAFASRTICAFVQDPREFEVQQPFGLPETDGLEWDIEPDQDATGRFVFNSVSSSSLLQTNSFKVFNSAIVSASFFSMDVLISMATSTLVKATSRSF